MSPLLPSASACSADSFTCAARAQRRALGAGYVCAASRCMRTGAQQHAIWAPHM